MTLSAFEMEPTWLTFPGRAILYPSVYSPSTQFERTKFSITADAARLCTRGQTREDDETFVRAHMSAKGFITASSIARPEVECFDVPRLAAMFQSLDARNVNRDKIFATCPIVSFGVSPYRHTVPQTYGSGRRPGEPDKEGPSFGYMLYLHKIRISLPIEVDEDVLL